MFGLGFTELLVIITLCILFIPPKKYPKLLVQTKKMLKTLGELNTTLQRELMALDYEDERPSKAKHKKNDS